MSFFLCGIFVLGGLWLVGEALKNPAVLLCLMFLFVYPVFNYFSHLYFEPLYKFIGDDFLCELIIVSTILLTLSLILYIGVCLHDFYEKFLKKEVKNV